MDMKAFVITTKIMVGEDVTEDEKTYARNYNTKYSIVRHLVMEKIAEDTSLVMSNFHFTPGEDFMSTPTVDIVNSLLATFDDIKNSRFESLSFDDSN